MENPLRLKSLNHISILCRSLEESLDFYLNVLGFFPIRRPGSFDFEGAWYTYIQSQFQESFFLCLDK